MTTPDTQTSPNTGTVPPLPARAQLFRSIFESSGIGIVLCDLEGHIIETNLSFQALLGYSASELLQKTVAQVTHPEDWQREAEHFARPSTATGPNRFRQIEKRYVHKKGHIVWGRLTSSFILNSQGQPIFGIGMVEDITARKQVENDLRISEQRYRTVVNTLPIGIAEIDFTGTIIFTNRSHDTLFRCAEAGMLGTKCWNRIPIESEREYLQRRMREALATQVTPRPFQTTAQRLDGSLLDLQVDWNYQRTASGQVVGLILVESDITERKRLEQEILKTQKLETIGLLAGGIAHDFNNILTAILGNIAMARLTGSPPGATDVSTLLEEAEKACFRAKSLTQQLLTFAMEGVPVKQTASLSDIISESATFTLRGAASQCTLDLAPDLWAAEVDPGQISQVIQNLVLNADQAMPGGGSILITARNRVVDAGAIPSLVPGRYVVVSVTDTGIGIPSAHMDRIFLPYFTTKQKGSGLGLATTFGIIKKHGGHIDLESHVGKGTTFTIYLPASGSTVAPAVPAAPRPIRPGSGRILVMDDDHAIRNLVVRMLQLSGYEVVAVPDGDEAVSVFSKERQSGRPFAAVLLDLTVPGGMGGEEACARLRAIDPSAKVIVTSGYANDPILVNYQAFGFSGVISKPFRPQELTEVLGQTLS